tara:strand:+ start:747 stop:1202 length:456 start_codon:yes stop_codon:yes gene_type:complete
MEEALKDRLSNMSNEELEEFNKKNCIFCKIVDNKVSAMPVYRDQNFLAILDIKPGSKGHTLLFPREHKTVLPQISDETLGEMFIVMKKISNAILKGMKADGTNIYIANGASAGQKCNHVLSHIIPRFNNDKMYNLKLKRDKDNAKILEKLR